MVDWSNISRKRQNMTPFVRTALLQAGQMKAFRARPAYQQNDYLAWIARAKKDETKRKRLHQMIQELKKGNVYMKMAWRPKK